MDYQLSLEHLATLFFAVEGLSLWKLPAPKVDITPENDQGENTQKNKNSPKMPPELAKCKKEYEWWYCVCKHFCSYYPLVWFSIIAIAFYWLSEVMAIYAFSVLPILVEGYIVMKLFWVIMTHMYAKKYESVYRKCAKVDAQEHNTEEDGFQPVSDNSSDNPSDHPSDPSDSLSDPSDNH